MLEIEILLIRGIARHKEFSFVKVTAPTFTFNLINFVIIFKQSKNIRDRLKASSDI